MTRKLLVMALTLVAIAGTALFAVVSPAAAQAGSGVGLCTTVSGIQNVGTVTVGQTFVLQLAPTCVFTVGASITVTVNGVNIPGKVADVNGLTRVTVTVVSATQLSIDDPILTPAICGTNTVTAQGPSPVALGGISTQTANFTVACAAVPVVATPGQGRLSLTGANSLRYAALALALLAAGSMALVTTRRRRANDTV